MGEITTSCYVDIAGIARNTITRIGYDNAECGFDGRSCSVLTAIDKQSADIAMGVDTSYDDAAQTGAGDQGMMFGFACNETKELMPAPISYAHNLTRALTAERKSGKLPWLRPDGKSQVSVQYAEDGSVERIDTVVVSTQHSADVSISELREAVIEEVIKPNLPSRLLDANTRFLVNPTGRFVIGGPVGDSGLTGRKIIVDTYGGRGAHGGGAFSGKDPTKVDRSAAYMARYIAKNIVAAGLASVPAGAGLRHRRGGACLRAGRYLRHRQAQRLASRRAGTQVLRPPSGLHHPDARPAPPDLSAGRGLRPLRPPRAGSSVGKARPRRAASEKRLSI